MQSASHQRPDRDELVDAFGPMVERIARRIWRALRLRIDVDDLVQLGMVGLVEAWERFDDTAGVPFGGFAHLRVRGAILDGLSGLTGMSRAQVRLLQRFRGATDYQESHAVAGATTAVDDATWLANAVRGVTLAADFAELADATDADDAPVSGSAPIAPDRAVERKRGIENLHAALDRLPDDQARLLREHYLEGRSLADIGADLGVSRSWACRLHARAIDAIRQHLPDGRARAG